MNERQRGPHLLRPHASAGRRLISRAGSAALLALAFISSGRATCADEAPQPSGTVKIEQVQVAFIGSGNLGGGTLQFGDRHYEFTIGGLGVGGFGASRITATGEVYNLTDLANFPGAYVQGRYGMAISDVSAGELWLENANGVVLRLKAERVGLALSLGGDAVYIDFN